MSGAVAQAQSGLRSDVSAFLEALQQGFLFVPLAENIEGVQDDQETELDGELSFRPHMLVHDDGSVFAAAFTEPQLVEDVAEMLDWKTSEGELKFVHLPGLVVLDLGVAQFDDKLVAGLVINAGTELELLLSREEAASLAQGTPLPLVGYVDELPEGMEDNTQIVEGADPPPPALLAALDGAKEKLKHLLEVEVLTTFNPERDREPHLTIFLTVVGDDGQRAALADEVMQDAIPHLPAPGYADIVFRDAPN